MKKIIAVLFISVISCAVAFSQNAQKSNTNTAASEEFSIFQSQFFSDSIFQVSRIRFPLEFIKPDAYPRPIQQADWKFTGHLYWNKTNPSDIHFMLVDVYPGATNTTVNGRLDNGNYEKYYFDLLNGKWFLVKLEIPDL